MNYGIAENEIVTRINAKLTELGFSNTFFCAAMPENDKEAKEFDSQIQKTRVAVEYSNSDYEPNSSLSVVRQVEHVTFRLLFDGKKLKGADGIYTLQAHVKNFLLGYRLSNSEEMSIAGEGKLQYEPSVWMPYIDFKCTTLNSQAFVYPEPIIEGTGNFSGIV